ncbi:MAG: DEAD/DEAH box helicase [Patescibacteria group bacterium]
MTQPVPTQPSGSFYGLGIAPKLLECLDRLKYTIPTPIQEKAIPIAIEGKDLIGIAQTGTGKTLAFGIPMLQRLAQVKGKGLVILPTRELALQVDEVYQKLGGPLGLRTAVIIGGASMERQKQMLGRTPHVIIGTPGRIIDHINQRTLNLFDVSILVLDEADRMLDMGFAPQIKRILQAVPKERHTMLFSATMPDDIVRIATAHMKLPLRVEIARAGTAAEKVAQELFVVRKDQKNRLLDKLLQEYHGTVLVFSRTKFGARKIARAVRGMGHTGAEIHSDRSLAQRREALDGFKTGKYRVLVATDIAARGIDVVGIELVLNYDIPDNPEDYIHRIGRTGRAGRVGRAISFATPDQGSEVRDIEKLARVNLPISKLPELPPERPMSPEPPSYGQSSSHGGRPFGSGSGGNRRPFNRGRGGFGRR